MSQIKETYAEAELKLKSLENIDLNEDINTSEFYDAIVKINSKDKDSALKQEEAEFLIKRYSSYIGDSTLTALDAKRQKIYDLLRKYDANSDLVQDFKTKNVNEIYTIAKYMLQDYKVAINDTKFTLTLSDNDFKFLRRTLNSNVEYDSVTIFHYVELVDSFLNDASIRFDSSKKTETFTFEITINNILIIQELMKGVKIKGGSTEFRNFKAILFSINECIRLYNAFGVVVERISDDFLLWGTALDSIAKSNEPAVEIADIAQVIEAGK